MIYLLGDGRKWALGTFIIFDIRHGGTAKREKPPVSQYTEHPLQWK